jgi:hypothetical protein
VRTYAGSHPGTMFKTSDERLRQALDAIRVHAGPEEAEYIDEELSRGVRLRFAPLLDIGSYDGKFRNTDEKAQRKAVRGLILAGLVLGRIKDTDVTLAMKRELMDVPLDEVVRRMKRAFPYRAFSGRFSNIDAWDPANFTQPVDGVMGNFKFFVHSIMADASKVASKAGMTQMEWDATLRKWDASISEVKKGGMGDNLFIHFAKQYLANPSILKSTIISTTLLSHQKRACYYPFGFILSVPKENVYSASSKDQSVTNRAANAVTELARVYTQKGGGKLATPDEILQGTTGTTGSNGYNEVVVVGRSPEGQEVSVTGIFVKTHPNGNFYVPPGQTKPYLTPELWTLVKAQRAKGLAVVRIVDSSSAPSTSTITF